MHTVKEAAKLLGVGRSTVNLHCVKLDVSKHGNAYVITDADLDRLRESIRNERGRPPKGSA